MFSLWIIITIHLSNSICIVFHRFWRTFSFPLLCRICRRGLSNKLLHYLAFDFHAGVKCDIVKRFWVSLGKYLQSFGRYSKFCQTLGTLDGVFLGESPRSPLSKESADSKTICVVLKETDLVLTSRTGTDTL